MHEIRKYPRTAHIRGSRFQHGDHDMEAVPWKELQGKPLVIEEKVDGTNVGISFDEDGTLLLQSRGHYLRGGAREKQFDLLKQWAASKQEEFYCALGTRYIMYGEWLLCKHTFFYDALPHYFMEFDVLDTTTGDFLSTPARQALLVNVPVSSVRVLSTGTVSALDEMQQLITKSHFITDDRFTHLDEAATNANVVPAEARKHTDPSELMEGLYVKWEEAGIVKGRYKYVRGSFTNTILDQEQHWHDRPIIQNRLVPEAFEKMFA